MNVLLNTLAVIRSQIKAFEEAFPNGFILDYTDEKGKPLDDSLPTRHAWNEIRDDGKSIVFPSPPTYEADRPTVIGGIVMQCDFLPVMFFPIRQDATCILLMRGETVTVERLGHEAHPEQVKRLLEGRQLLTDLFKNIGEDHA